MTERQIQFRYVRFLIYVVAFASLYAYGGINNLWLRRYVAPAVLSIALYAETRKLSVSFQMLLLFLSLSIGYGSEILWLKIIKRFLFGLANISTSLMLLIDTANRKKFILAWSLYGVIVLSTVVVLGVWNPFNARAEELLIGLMIASFIPYLTTIE